MIAIPYKLLGLISALLFLAVAPMPYGFYIFTKIVVCGCAGLACYQLWDSGYKGLWLYIWGVMTILFNPFIPISMQKKIWMIVDGLAGLIFAYSAYRSFSEQKLKK